MNIKEINRDKKEMTITLSETESISLVNILYRARKSGNLKFSDEYRLNAELIVAKTILHSGILPDSERNLVVDLCNEATKLDNKKVDNNG